MTEINTGALQPLSSPTNSKAMATKNWKDVVIQKRKDQASTIPKDWLLKELPSKDTFNVIDYPEQCGILTSKEIDITRTDVTVLLEKLSKGTWTAVEVTTAFAKRAVIAQQLVNCLTEIFIDRALARATQLDNHLRTTGQVVGPLHGLPISLKDQINIEGIDSSLGYVIFAGKPATKNAVLVDILEAAGAVLYVKTNVPQTLMWGETYNNVFGRTTNPYNRHLTPGGSSGGEGALVALRGSLIGVGSDVAGSVRIPAAYNGLYGLRGSYGRIPYAGCANSLEGQDSIPSVLGPLSTSIDGIKLFVKTVLEQRPWLKDAAAVRKPWNEDEYKLVDHGHGEKLCFAILWDDGYIVPHPPIIRALHETKHALVAAGHQVIDWKPWRHAEIYRTTCAVFEAGAVEDFLSTTVPTGEPLLTTLDLSVEDQNISPNQPDEEPFFRPNPKGVSAYELWQIQKKKHNMRQEYLEYWNKTTAVTGTGRPVDAIISPCASTVAPPHGTGKGAGYTAIWNMLDSAALAIPTGLSVDPRVDARKPPHKFYSIPDKVNYEIYDTPETYKNAPIGLQVVGRTLEEEGVIAMSEIVDAALKKHLNTL